MTSPYDVITLLIQASASLTTASIVRKKWEKNTKNINFVATFDVKKMLEKLKHTFLQSFLC